MDFIGFSVLILNTTAINYALTVKYVWNNSARTTGSLLTSPTNFDIPDMFETSSGGYDGNCVIGLAYIWMGGSNLGFYQRSVLFDAKTNPFSSVQNTLPLDASGNT